MLIVSRTKPGTYAYMKLVGESQDVVLFDRREGDRRSRKRRYAGPDRRRGVDRRRDVDLDAFERLGWSAIDTDEHASSDQ